MNALQNAANAWRFASRFANARNYFAAILAFLLLLGVILLSLASGVLSAIMNGGTTGGGLWPALESAGAIFILSALAWVAAAFLAVLLLDATAMKAAQAELNGKPKAWDYRAGFKRLPALLGVSVAVLLVGALSSFIFYSLGKGALVEFANGFFNALFSLAFALSPVLAVVAGKNAWESLNGGAEAFQRNPFGLAINLIASAILGALIWIVGAFVLVFFAGIAFRTGDALLAGVLFSAGLLVAAYCAAIAQAFKAAYWVSYLSSLSSSRRRGSFP
ncbi:hypothetical protein COX86_03875 [Candidatus Micrarchaeota archaeon CG_4_10_14_0_2_um_filter_60_11]|nr:MAG: hypothetical protein AUJ16_00650 [Candidatus Micrarchaeota archaeon CG1_02_60_51]PIN95992.1 MAG: hypothetical protein COU39_03230 [Candidatus Micrarchaeota archaeon CG10_big_fil_rev_8_21_14_0_10_60_32]PIO02378.1 MAG: hypothetical protein COT58_00475 [Candidatus Micrarchaeota archaeon CG09_land_8_20_14_0_10_60_16]PIY91681.1 MAG: hypothetical protein COY71_01875 [Candidatus Micrarchaeota archaeon CG_4_10_14_0_8_um_filter_60_7]PIZ90642.1 MAG: hypothetical protein COX86_03875 [Candidatus Mi